MEQLVWDKYSELSDDDVKSIVVDDKWIKTLSEAVEAEMQRISQRLTQRIKELAERYESSLPVIEKQVDTLENKIKQHLKKMGFE